jgi:hypothetical protein
MKRARSLQRKIGRASGMVTWARQTGRRKKSAHCGDNAMRIGIVVDSACDLPGEFLQRHAITILPIAVRLDEQTLVDDRDPATLQRFFSENLGERGHDAETEPYSVEQVRDLFLGRLVIDYDCVFCLTITSTRSPIHAHASIASYAILKDYRPIRRDAGVTGPFLMRVIDSETLFAAQGVSAVEAVRLRAAGENPARNPSWPRFTPRTGRPWSATSRAARSIVPSPPRATARSTELPSSASGTTSAPARLIWSSAVTAGTWP